MAKKTYTGSKLSTYYPRIDGALFLGTVHGPLLRSVQQGKHHADVYFSSTVNPTILINHMKEGARFGYYTTYTLEQLEQQAKRGNTIYRLAFDLVNKKYRLILKNIKISESKWKQQEQLIVAKG